MNQHDPVQSSDRHRLACCRHACPLWRGAPQGFLIDVAEGWSGLVWAAEECQCFVGDAINDKDTGLLFQSWRCKSSLHAYTETLLMAFSPMSSTTRNTPCTQFSRRSERRLHSRSSQRLLLSFRRTGWVKRTLSTSTTLLTLT